MLFWYGRVLLATVLLLFSFATHARADTGSATAVKVINKVNAADAMAISRQIRNGSKIGEGESVSAGRRSMAVFTFNGDNKMKIGPESTVTFKQLAHRTTVNKKTRIVLEAGGALFDINKRDNEHVEVNTSVASMGIRGTSFMAAYERGARRLWLSVFSGSVVVRAARGSTSAVVNAGQSIVVDDGIFSEPADYSFGKQASSNFNDGASSLDIKALAKKWLPTFLAERKEIDVNKESRTSEKVKVDLSVDTELGGVDKSDPMQTALILAGIAAAIGLIVFLLRK